MNPSGPSGHRLVSSGRGVGPSAVGQLLRDRSLRLATALAVAVAIPVAVLFSLQFRSLNDLGQASTVVLRQLSEQTADRVTAALVTAFKSPYLNVLLRITQQQTEPLNLPLIRATFERSLAADPFVDRFYVWSDVTDVHAGRLLAYDRGTGEFRTGVPEAEPLLQRIRELAPEKRAINAFEMTIGGRRTYVQAQLRFRYPARDRLTSFVALTIDAERLRRTHVPRLVGAALAQVPGPTGFPPLEVTVLDADDAVVYPPGGRSPAEYVDERRFPLVFFDPELVAFAAPADMPREIWRLRTGYGAETIPGIVGARARPQRALMIALAAVMALGVCFVAWAMAREVRLAELRSSFVASVSHDLKTPLALIQLFAETLELGRLKNTDRAHEYYRIINSEARKLTRLINNLLDFSRIEAGLRRYEPEPVQLGALTAHVLESLESQFRLNQFTIRTRLAEGVTVLVDPEAVQQAIENLLSNAMKYSPDHREIVVEVDVVDGHGCVHVTDRGLGIPGRFQRRIFRKFYRVQHDAGSGPQGTGLGLSIVEHVMRAHGGFVRVDSEPGRGSTFSLHFPLHSNGADSERETDTGDRGRAADVARSA